MIDNLVNQNNLSEEMYNKVLRVIKAIDTEIMQYEKIEHKSYFRNFYFLRMVGNQIHYHRFSMYH